MERSRCSRTLERQWLARGGRRSPSSSTYTRVLMQLSDPLLLEPALLLLFLAISGTSYSQTASADLDSSTSETSLEARKEKQWDTSRRHSMDCTDTLTGVSSDTLVVCLVLRAINIRNSNMISATCMSFHIPSSNHSQLRSIEGEFTSRQTGSRQ